MRFTKMHGIGNDYVYVNCFEEQISDPPALARVVSDRHTGIGGDGLIMVCPSQTADVRMRIFNADGSEAEMCGNGCRCVAKYAYDHGLVESAGDSMKIETGNGVLTVGLQIGADGKVEQVCVNMGEPILAARDIPVDLAGEKIVDEPITILGQQLLMTCVSMGNPHAVFFCEDVNAIELEKIGPEIENHPLFPNRINVHFVQIDSENAFTMRTWERGSGITLACGTGACACGVAAVLTGRAKRVCTATLPGGQLELNWSDQDNCVYMTGPATEVFEGLWAG